MSVKGQRRVHRSAAEWRTILERFDRSGRSQQAFCREAGISLSAFQNWRRRSRLRHTVPAQFIDVTPVTPPTPRWAIEIEFPDGTTARVRG